MSDNPEIKNTPASSEDLSTLGDEIELMIQRKKEAAAKKSVPDAAGGLNRPSPASQRRAVSPAPAAPNAPTTAHASHAPTASNAPQAASPAPSPASQRRAQPSPGVNEAATRKRSIPAASVPARNSGVNPPPKSVPAHKPAVQDFDDDSDELIPLRRTKKASSANKPSPANKQIPARGAAEKPENRKPASQRNQNPVSPKPQSAAAAQAQDKTPASSAPYAVRRSAAPPDSSPTKKTGLEKLIPKSISHTEKKPVKMPDGGESAKKEKVKEKKKLSSAQNGADMMASIIKAIIYMVVVVVIAVFISIFVIKIGNDVFAFVKDDIAVDVSIPENATVEDIAGILYDDGVIKYPRIFKLYASLKKDEEGFIAGDYTVSPSMSYDELRYAFKEHIATGTSWITIPEGYSTDEIIDLMVSNGIGEREKYIDVINNYDFDFWFMEDLKTVGRNDGRAYRLEGYLFPDTYEFYNASSEEMVIKKLLKRFDEVFVADYKTKATELGFTVDEILTLASMIEKEAGGAADYMYVSSVFHNRLRNWEIPYLGSDASIVYAIQIGTGLRPSTITHDDLSYDSPYNTYTHEGLPPGPITNPSASAIRYALYPAPTDYYYFITADNGKAYYATTKEAHAENIEYVNQINAKLASG